ncbi:glycosyltransferase family 39 protein [Streptosporangiaceae bacterium NEAU-GS5]|nr:glycosyltransferase family 39 protein [Streptosporangiaceae bacterium NEAU-GS5]
MTVTATAVVTPGETRPLRRIWWVPIVPALVALAMGAWQITIPSMWRDESVTAVVARMPLPDMWRLLGDMDAVHGLYYFLMRPLAASGWPVEWALRLPSLVAFAATAYGVAALGGRLAGPWAGLCGGLIYALLPIASRYGQEARSYALVSAVTVLATWLLLAAVERPGFVRFAAYALSVALLGWLHVYALLMLIPHAFAGWRRPIRWLLALAVAAALLAPLALTAAGQRDTQLYWLKVPTPDELAAFPLQVAGSWQAVGVIGVATLAGLWRTRRIPVVAAWAVLPVLISYGVSQVYPMYHPRYVLFAVPGMAVLAGAGLVWLGRLLPPRWAPPALGVVLVGVLTAGTQVAIRQPDSRADDLRALANTLRTDELPGDGVLYVPDQYRLFVGAYPEPYDRLTDLTRASGVYWPRSGQELLAAATGLTRVWVVSPSTVFRYRDDPRLLALRTQFKKGEVSTFGSIHLVLYTRKR